MLGPILPAPGGGGARRPLALAFHQHRTGDAFHEATDPQGRSRRQLKMERKMMKLIIRFGGESRFDQPIWCIAQTRMPWSPGLRDSSRALAMAGWPKPTRPELTGGVLQEDLSP